MKLVRILVPLALIAICLAVAGRGGVIERLSDLSVAWMAVTVGLLSLVILLSAVRWRLTARALGLPLSVRTAIADYYMAQFVNQTLPGGVLGDVARATRSRAGGPLTPAAQAVVLERLSGQFGMGLILTAGLTALMIAPGATLPAATRVPAVVWASSGVLLAVVAIVSLIALHRHRGSWGAAARTALLGHFGAQTGLSLTIASLTVLAVATATRAVGGALPFTSLLLVGPVILTAMLLPASIAGWGWREGAAAVLFPLAGEPAASGLAASIAYGAAALIAALPGAFHVLPKPSIVAPRD